jgi:hypothetical protein
VIIRETSLVIGVVMRGTRFATSTAEIVHDYLLAGLESCSNSILRYGGSLDRISKVWVLVAGGDLRA